MVNSLYIGNIIKLRFRASVVFILLLLIDCVLGFDFTSNVKCQGCYKQNRKLAEIYERREVIQNVRQNCIYVKEFLRCAEPLESQCRQDLNFQGALTLMRSFRDEKKCASMNITWGETLNVYNAGRTGGQNTTKQKQCRRPNFKPVYKICGLFGDPHLRTFSDKRHTCAVPGAWPLFANRYLTVQVTNIPLAVGARATATSKVRLTLIFSSYNSMFSLTS